MTAIPRKLAKYYVLRFLSGFIFTYVIQAIFLLSRGITISQLALFGSLTIIFSTFFELPTGFIADKFGRKYSVSLSYLFNTLALILIIFVHDFNLLIMVAFLKGLGSALESGALESLVYEEVVGGDKKDNFLKVTTTGTNIAIIAGVITTFTGPLLYLVNPIIPFILSAIIYGIMTIFILFFNEVRNSNEVSRNIRIIDGVKTIVKIKPILTIVMIDLLLRIFVNIYYQVLFIPKINGLGMPVKYLGIVDVLTLGFTSLLLLFISKITWKRDIINLTVYTLAVGVIFVIFGISRTLVPALIFGMLFDPVWNIRRHVIPTITNKYFESRNRSLNISSMSFISNLGAAIIAPFAIVLFNNSYYYSLIPLALIFLLIFFYYDQQKIAKV